MKKIHDRRLRWYGHVMYKKIRGFCSDENLSGREEKERKDKSVVEGTVGRSV